MTPDELRSKCEQFVNQKFIDSDNPLTPHGHVIELESLCREMMAEGLRRAAVEAERRQDMILAPGHHVEFVSGFRCACYDLQYWCRQEAQRVKEGR